MYLLGAAKKDRIEWEKLIFALAPAVPAAKSSARAAQNTNDPHLCQRGDTFIIQFINLLCREKLIIMDSKFV